MLIKELCDRYGLSSRKSLYSRINTLHLELPKDSQGRAYAADEQLKLLDQLHEHLKNGGTLGNFTPVTPVEIEPQHSLQHTTQHSHKAERIRVPVATQHSLQHTTQHSIFPQHTNEFLGEMVKAIATEITSRLQPYDPTWYMSVLERAAVSNWVLSTSEVQQLIGVKPRLKKGDRTFTRGCWCFFKMGKIGSQTGWKVVKKIEGGNSYKV